MEINQGIALINKSNSSNFLLKLFSYELSEIQLIEIKTILAKYFAKKAGDEMDQLWEDNNWSNDTMNQWLNEHKRTKYE